MNLKNEAPFLEPQQQHKDIETSSDGDYSIGKSHIDREVLEHVASIVEKSLSGFPTHVFPRRIQGMIFATNECLSFPVEFVASAVVFAVSLAVGNNYKIVPRTGWTESSALWVALIGKAGAAKSPVLKFVLKPFVELEKKANRDYGEKVKEYHALSKQERALLEEPMPVRYFAQDATQEALMVTHSRNGRGVGLKYDELSSWWDNLDRYNGNSEGLFLSGWDGDGNKIDRISRPSIEIDEMYIPIIGGTQPSKLSSLAKGGRDSSGFMARFLYCFPVDVRKGLWNNKSLDSKHANYWYHVISKLVEQVPPKQKKLQIAPEAYIVLEKWQHKNANQVNELGEGTLAEMYNKAERQCVRLALVFQLLFWACDEDNNDIIGLRAVKAAITVTEYFKKDAKKVCDHIYNSSPLDRMKKNHREFYTALPDEFSRKQATNVGLLHEVRGGTLNRLLANKELFDKNGQSHYVKRQ